MAGIIIGDAVVFVPTSMARNIPELIAAAASGRPDQPALWRRCDGRYEPMAYDTLVGAVTALSARLAADGCVAHDHVAIWISDRFSWGVAYLGVLWAGAVAVPIDPLLTPGEVAAIVHEAEVHWVIADGVAVEAAGFGSGVRVLPLRDLWPGSGRVDTPPVPLPDTPPDALAAILFTSGTTGVMKGVMLTHANIVADVEAIAALGLVDPGDRMLSILPIHHAYECTVGFLYPLSVGAQVAFARSLKSAEILEDLRDTGATCMLGVPALFEKVVKGIKRRIAESGPFRRTAFALSAAASRSARRIGWRGPGRVLFRPLRRRAGLASLRLTVSGAAALPWEVAEFFDTIGLPLLQGYGLSEAAPVVSVNPPHGFRYDSVGPPLPGVEVRIRDPRPDGIGEVAVRGPMVMRGYWCRPDLTAAVLQDGWLLTGDLGSLGADGHLRIVGRSKNVIVSGAGKNIHPEEIEAVLCDQPGIAEAVVYGRSRPGKIGEIVAAVIVPDREWFHAAQPEALADPALMREAVANGVRNTCARLAPFKHIVEWQIRMKPFERTTTRKIKRHLVTGDHTRPVG